MIEMGVECKVMINGQVFEGEVTRPFPNHFEITLPDGADIDDLSLKGEISVSVEPPPGWSSQQYWLYNLATLGEATIAHDDE